MKTIYIYNCNNKNEFICTKTVQDNLNTLYYATEIAYPETEQGYTRCFNIETNTWSQPIKDYRGKTIYRKDNSTISQVYENIGQLSSDWTDITPPSFLYTYKLNSTNNIWELIQHKHHKIKRYSKLSIIRQLKKINLWENIKQIIIDNDAMDQWLSAQFLREDDPLFISIKTILTEKYKDINIEQLLLKCHY